MRPGNGLGEKQWRHAAVAAAFVICLFVRINSQAAERLIHENRDEFVTRFGKPVARIESPRAALHGMVVERFQTDGWEYVVYFDDLIARRVIVTKSTREKLSDAEIAELLLPNKHFSPWSVWKATDRRAWCSDGKFGVIYAVVSAKGGALEFVTTVYLDALAKQVWLDSVDQDVTCEGSGSAAPAHTE